MIKNSLILFVAIALLATGCIKNEEADGVKALREAQAELLKARANATLKDAEANAAFMQAKTAIENAKAAYEEAVAKAKQLENELLTVQTEAEKAEIAARLEVVKLQIEKERVQAELALQKAVKDAEVQLKEADLNLREELARLAAYETQLDNQNPTLDYLIGAYTTALSKVAEARETILNLNQELVLANLYINDGYYEKGYPGERMLVEVFNIKKESLTKELAEAKAMLKLLEDNLTSTSDAKEKIEALKTALVKLENEKLNKERVYVETRLAYQISTEEFESINDEYWDAYNLSRVIDLFENNVNWGDYISKEDLETYTNEPQTDGRSLQSVAYFKDLISKLDKDDVSLAFYKAELKIAEAHLNNLKTKASKLGNIQELSKKYFAARKAKDDALLAQTEASEAVLLVEKQINNKNTLLEAYENNFEAIEEAIKDQRTEIANITAKLAGLDNMYSSWEAYKEGVTKQIEVEESLLVIKEKKVADIKTQLDAEIETVEE